MRHPRHAEKTCHQHHAAADAQQPHQHPDRQAQRNNEDDCHFFKRLATPHELPYSFKQSVRRLSCVLLHSLCKPFPSALLPIREFRATFPSPIREIPGKLLY
jgi:hypothetical protein